MLTDDAIRAIEEGTQALNDRIAFLAGEVVKHEGKALAFEDDVRQYEQGIDKIIEEIKIEIAKRPQYPNIGKKGCLNRLIALRRGIK